MNDNPNLAKWKAALSAHHAAQRRGRVRYPVPQITGIRWSPRKEMEVTREISEEAKRRLEYLRSVSLRAEDLDDLDLGVVASTVQTLSVKLTAEIDRRRKEQARAKREQAQR